MSDATLNRFVAYGTNAQRLAFTPSPPTPASGPSQLYFWWETDTSSLWAFDTTWHDVSNAGGAFSLTGTISPAALGADQNDYAPTGFATCSAVRLSASVATVNITGLAGGSAGRFILIFNVGASNNLVLKNESASSTAANRFDATADVTLAPSAWTLLWYDGTSSRWRVLVSSGGGGGSGTVTSVAVSSSDGLLTVGGSPVTTTGTITLAVAEARTPTGRLTLTSGTPVLAADATAQGTIYYTPYIGNLVPIWSGSVWTVKTFAEISLTLNATDNLSGSLYDIFVFNNSGTLTLGTGPAWTSTTARGTGAGTTELQMLNGIWTNKNAITLRAGGSSLGSQAANTCTYLGTAYMTANGQTGMAFLPAAAAGGANNILGLYNAYNRVTAKAENRDSTGSWTYNSTTYRAMNASNSNRISFVDGLQQSRISGRRFVSVIPSAAVATDFVIGMDLDSTSAAPQATTQVTDNRSSGFVGCPMVHDAWAPQLGFHFIQAIEATSASGSFFGAQTTPTRQLNAMVVELEM